MRSTLWLRIVRFVLGVMLFLDVGGLVALLLNHGSGSVGTVSSGYIFAGDPYVNRMHQELRVDDVFVAPVAEFTTAQRVLFAVSHGIAFCVAVIPMLILARSLITRVLAEDPFTLRMVRRLRVLGVVVLAGGAASELAGYIAARILFASVVPPDIGVWAWPDYHATLWWLMPGLILLAVAEVVRRGCTLRDELDTVI